VTIFQFPQNLFLSSLTRNHIPQNQQNQPSRLCKRKNTVFRDQRSWSQMDLCKFSSIKRKKNNDNNNNIPVNFLLEKFAGNLRLLLLNVNRYWFDQPSAQKVDKRIQRALFFFACTNSSMNPIIYGIFNIRQKNKVSIYYLKQIVCMCDINSRKFSS